MKLRKPNKKEQKSYLRASGNAFVFYAIALLIWSMYDVVTVGELSWQFVIFSVGMLVFWLSIIFLRKRIESEKETRV